MRLPHLVLVMLVSPAFVFMTAGCEQIMGPDMPADPQPAPGPAPEGDVIGRPPAEPGPMPTEPDPQAEPRPRAPSPQAGDRDYIPPTAIQVAAEAGRHMNHRADRDGRIYVQEASTGRVIHSGRIRQGEEFDINPHDNRATIDGRTVLDSPIDAQTELRIFFEPDEN